MFFKFKNHCKYILIPFLIILNACQLQEPTKNHGILFLENRANKIKINENNKNDVIKLIGSPHSKSIKNEDTWLYFQRTITRGKLIKLGQNVLKENKVLELKFDKFGILITKKIHNKNDMNKVKYSKKETENNVSQQSFVGKFLSSVRQKMYGRGRKF